MTAHFLRQMARVVCLFLLLGAIGSLSAQPKRFRPAPEYSQLGKPDQEEGRSILEKFRGHGLYPGQHYLEFSLTVLPRRGPERVVLGRLWGSHDERGNLTRIVLSPGVQGQESRLLVQVGPESAAWSWRPGQLEGVQSLAPAALFDRLADTDVTAFDLEMPFLYWKEFVFEGVSKVRGRPAHVFLLYPPPAFAETTGKLSGVRLYLDTQYNVVVQFEELGPDSKPLQSMSVLDLKKIGDQWIVKAIDYRDEVTRNKSRFSVLGAADDLEYSPSLFTPAVLADSIQPPPVDRIVKTGP